ncbi:hypothetical protein [uncultured Psychroserpens sp.]|nr:hypothetical protein [uncultured Psychroserpens sp.]
MMIILLLLTSSLKINAQSKLLESLSMKSELPNTEISNTIHN